jgi:predicted nucleic acid-binding protein
LRVALDTNVLAYAEGVNGTGTNRIALELLGKLPQASVVLPVQTLGELFQVLVRKAGRSTADARSAILGWRDAFALFETSAGAMLAATDLVFNHQLGLWDAVILCVACGGRLPFAPVRRYAGWVYLAGSNYRQSICTLEEPVTEGPAQSTTVNRSAIHSARKVWMGSRADALRAGMSVANTPPAISTQLAAAKAQGSVSRTP